MSTKVCFHSEMCFTLSVCLHCFTAICFSLSTVLWITFCYLYSSILFAIELACIIFVACVLDFSIL